MELLYWCAIIFGILCLAYYIILLFYAGTGVNFAWIWCLGGLSSLCAGLLIRYVINSKLHLPTGLLSLIYLLIIVAIISFLTLEGILLLYSHHKAVADLDYLLVLGAQIRENKVSNNLQRRLDTALTYLRANPRTRVIVTGGRGTEELISEAAAMKAYLMEQGINLDRILAEEQSSNTIENIRFSKSLMHENASIAIVTNGFHIFRTVKLARKQGLTKLYALVAPTELLMAPHYYVREAAGVGKDWLKGNL